MTDVRTLADDVRLLGDTLGHVLEAHGGRAFFDAVESMRTAAKQARDVAGGDAEVARARLAALAAELDDPMALDVIRAFTLYFQLINLAEDQQRARELRRRETSAPERPVSESIAAVVDELHARGATLEEVLDVLREVRVGFVFTAHPTEARRRTTERLLAGVRATLESRDRRALTPTELRGEDRRLRAAIEALWEHASERTERERYSRLTADPSLGERMFAKVRREYDRTVREVLAIVGQTALLEDDEVLAKSIRLRNPYVDPLSYLQIEAIRRARTAEREDARTQAERVARVAVQGIAAGLRYTG